MRSLCVCPCRESAVNLVRVWAHREKTWTVLLWTWTSICPYCALDLSRSYRFVSRAEHQHHVRAAERKIFVTEIKLYLTTGNDKNTSAKARQQMIQRQCKQKDKVTLRPSPVSPLTPTT